jgi:hypothetical protein
MVSRADYLTTRKDGLVIREELTRLFTWEERHRRLAARLLIALGLTLLVLAVGSVLIWVFESGVKGGDIHGYGDAAFFTAVQLLTISSAITNPPDHGRQDRGRRPGDMGDLRSHFDRGQLRLFFQLRRLQLDQTAEWREAGILVLLRGGCWTTGNQASRHVFGTACCRCCPVTSLTSRSRCGAAPSWLMAALRWKRSGLQRSEVSGAGFG